MVSRLAALLPNQRAVLALLAIALAPNVRATVPDAADASMHQFLAKDDAQHPYRATRRLEAVNGNRRGWLEAITEYSPEAGFRYEITAEGGSGFIRGKVLRAVLEAERDAIARGETARWSLARENYTFAPNGVDAEGLVNVLLTPRRKDRVLVAGTMFLEPTNGDLVRLQGRLAKTPSLWVKDVDIVRSYQHVGDTVVPVHLESTAQLRLLGAATLRMTYHYLEVDGQPIGPGPSEKIERP
jgi:hypothetical protein